MKIYSNSQLQTGDHAAWSPVGEFTNTWFDAHIPYWTALKEWANDLRSGGRSLRFLEIGCYEGRSALWLLENLVGANDVITCVDPWGPGPEWEEIHQRFLRNTHLDPDRKTSFAFWRDGPPEWPVYYDFIYIDGAHRSEPVFDDVLNGWRILAPNGIMLVDDFYNPGTPGEEQQEVERGLERAHINKGWPWPPARFGIDAIYQAL